MELDLKKHKNFAPIIVIIGVIFCNFGVLPALFGHSDTQKSRILCGFFVLRVRLYRGTKYNTP